MIHTKIRIKLGASFFPPKSNMIIFHFRVLMQHYIFNDGELGNNFENNFFFNCVTLLLCSHLESLNLIDKSIPFALHVYLVALLSASIKWQLGLFSNIKELDSGHNS